MSIALRHNSPGIASVPSMPEFPIQIAKTASNADHLCRPSLRFENARSALKAFLEMACIKPGEKVMLPAYIGVSAREGSGVFDPVRETGVGYAFYRLNQRLDIDLEDLERNLRTNRIRVLVIIHYFGYVDPAYSDAVMLARGHGALVLEDCAHAMLSAIVGGICGTLGDASIYSLHKLLPVPSGGMLVCHSSLARSMSSGCNSGQSAIQSPWEWDLAAISRKRRENATLLGLLLEPLSRHLAPLRKDLNPGTIPQTFPVLVSGISRDRLYHACNEAGFGAVSLYHTLIEALERREFPDSHNVASRILNLPVHQDATSEALMNLVGFLRERLPTEDGRPS